jgi:hypothetical protein
VSTLAALESDELSSESEIGCGRGRGGGASMDERRSEDMVVTREVSLSGTARWKRREFVSNQYRYYSELLGFAVAEVDVLAMFVVKERSDVAVGMCGEV